MTNPFLTPEQFSYRNTKANIEALTGLVGGETAYATDTGESGYYDAVASEWVWDVMRWDMSSPTTNDILLYDGVNLVWKNANPATARTALGLVAGGAGDIWVEKAGDTMTGKLFIDGTSDQIQLRVQGHSTQTANVVEVQNNSGTLLSGADKNGFLFSHGSFSTTNFFMGVEAAAAGTLAHTTAVEGWYNFGIGYRVLKAITTGYGNVALGSQSLTALTTGYNNTMVGRDSGVAITTGSTNVGIGVSTLGALTTGQLNIAIGASSMISSGTGVIRNVGVGANTLNAVTSNDNTAIGYGVGIKLKSGGKNVMIGFTSGQGGADYNATGNVFIGYQTGFSVVTSADYNVLVGYRSGYSVTTGDGNIFIGNDSGYRQTTNSNLLIIDNQQRASETVEVENSYLYGSMAAGGYLQLNIGTTTNNSPKDTLKLQAYVSTASTGAANGFGVGLPFYAETATDATYQQQGLISTSWIDATNATRKAKLSLSAYDTAARLGLEIEASGTEPKIGFYGVAPIARAVLATGAGASVDDVITALQNLGLVKQS